LPQRNNCSINLLRFTQINQAWLTLMTERIGNITRRTPLTTLCIVRKVREVLYKYRVLWDHGSNGFQLNGLRLRAELGTALADFGFEFLDRFLKPFCLCLVLSRIGCARASKYERGKFRTRITQVIKQDAVLLIEAATQGTETVKHRVKYAPLTL